MNLLRSTRRAALAALVLAVVAAVVVSAAGATSGTLYVTSNTILKEDQHGPIIINADNVTLDCAGHAVLGPGTTGISVYGRSHVTVRNCRVSGFAGGIILGQSASDVVTGNTVSDSSGYGPGGYWGVGIGVYGVTDSTFSDNVSNANDWFGFSLVHTSRVTVSRNSATNNGSIGIWVSESSGNSLNGNTATGNKWEGFEIVNAASSNLLAGNTSTGNGSDGFQVLGLSTANRLLGNVATGNGGDGFSVYARGNALLGNRACGNKTGFALRYAWQNSLTGNAAFANGIGFFVMRGSTNNEFTLNIGQGNTLVDAQDDNPAGANSWKANSFGTSSPPGLGLGRTWN